MQEGECKCLQQASYNLPSAPRANLCNVLQRAITSQRKDIGLTFIEVEHDVFHKCTQLWPDSQKQSRTKTLGDTYIIRPAARVRRMEEALSRGNQLRERIESLAASEVRLGLEVSSLSKRSRQIIAE